MGCGGAGSEMRDARCGMRDTGYGMRDAGFTMDRLPLQRRSKSPAHTDPAANVKDFVLKNILVRLIGHEAGQSTNGQPVAHTVTRAQGKNFTEVGTPAGVVWTHDCMSGGVQVKIPAQAHGVADINSEIIPLRLTRVGVKTDVCVGADRNLLGAGNGDGDLGI